MCQEGFVPHRIDSNSPGYRGHAIKFAPLSSYEVTYHSTPL